ncbi:putative S-adenosylmethionine-dependent methyltransferase [Candidatus Lokiarchaeum ossiferum]|uniref:S-adenosylmethionine-dependent methyltransferase n=1 Tax=Candidatus Lokiarchaeum ossiferum TaxID=2951803 RepID=A0ABY6HTS5_9ARCH|nr:putative S-adenosylmethionine-dependent methyltransferase [Candidatus Lokiarchaeum sp. B-35]
MPDPKDNHYFSQHPTSAQRMRKLFESVRAHSMSLQTSSGVFSPDAIDKGTRVLIENMIIPDSQENMNLLEIGAGYGPLTIWLHKEYNLRHHSISGNPPLPQIYASEVNDRAVWLLNRNLLANNCKDVIVLKGDFRDQIDELKAHGITFKAIFTNPPLKTGHEVMLELFQGAMDLLSPDGYIQYVHLKKLGAPGFLQKLQDLKPEWYFYILKKKGGFQVILISPIEREFEKEDYGGYF